MPRQKASQNRVSEAEKRESAPAAYEVDMTASAEAVYRSLYKAAKTAELAGRYASAHSTTFNMVREAVRVIIPSDPLNKRHALRGDLANVFRLRKGRMRICWIASSRLQRVCILFISEHLRKDGDASDPYAIFTSLLASGAFDDVIAKYRPTKGAGAVLAKLSAKPN